MMCDFILALGHAEFIKRVPQDISQCSGTQAASLTGHYCTSCWDPVHSMLLAALPALVSGQFL